MVEITVGEANQDEEKAYGDQQEAGREGRQADVTRLLAAWRAEVLKLLLQRGVDAEVAAEETRQARRMASEEREARGRAETEAKVRFCDRWSRHQVRRGFWVFGGPHVLYIV